MEFVNVQLWLSGSYINLILVYVGLGTRGFDTSLGEWISSISGRTSPRVYAASNRNEYQKKKNRALPVHKADNLTSICEPIV
jgi:hypothetical protein